MRRATVVLGLVLSAVAVAFVVYGIGSHESSSTVEPGRGEAKGAAQRAQQTSSAKKESNESRENVPLPSADSYQKPGAIEAFLDAGFDEDTARKELRRQVAREVRSRYSLLLEDLDLNPEEKEALLSLLINMRTATTTTIYKQGKPINMDERTKKIAAVIGDAKLQTFLGLERNLSAYSEVHKIGSILQQHGVPLADSQRDRLITTLVEVRERYKTPPSSDVERNSMEYLEHVVTQRDEFERHVMELAPSVLSAKQVRFLFEQYQHLAYERDAAVERQKDRIAAGEDVLLGYPAW